MDSGNKPESRTIRFKVLTPMRVVYDREAEIIVARTVDGDMGVLYGHEPCSALLKENDGAAELRVIADGKEELILCSGGIFTVRDNTATVLSEMAGTPEELQELIEKMRAERAARKSSEQTTELTSQRMELAIRQYLVKQDVSAYTILKDKTGQPAAKE